MHQCAHHHHPGGDYGWAFATGVGLNLAFVVVEATFGWYAGSLALLADAGHNLSDVLGLSMAWAGYALAKVAPSAQRTYGWRGSTILAALFNALLLLVAVGGIAWEAIGRLADPTEVAAPLVTGDQQKRLSLLVSGDDYELVFTAPPAVAAKVSEAARRCSVRVTRIGKTLAPGNAPSVRVRDEHGRFLEAARTGYQHVFG